MEKYGNFFSRGGGIFHAPIKDCLHSCTSKATASALRTASSRKTGSFEHVLRSASRTKTIKAGNLSKSSKKAGSGKAFDWKCKVCGASFHGSTYASIKGKITYHLMVIHGAQFKEALAQRRPWCAKFGDFVEELCVSMVWPLEPLYLLQGILESTLEEAKVADELREEIYDWVHHYEEGKLKSLPMKKKVE